MKGAGGAASSSESLTMNGTTASTGLSNLVVNDNNSSGNSTLPLSSTGLGMRGAATTLNIDLSQGLGGSGTDAITTTAAAATLGWATVKTSSTNVGFAAYNSSNVVELSGQSTFAASGDSSATDYVTAPTSSSTTASPYLTMSGAQSATSLTINTGSATGANVLDLGSGTLSLTQNAILLTGSNNFTIQDGQLAASNKELIVQEMGSGRLTIAANISSGTGSLTVSGGGVLALESSQMYTGATTINQGRLLVGDANVSNVSLASGSAVTVNNSGVLGGTGTVKGTVAVAGGGALAAGDTTAVGTLTISNTATLSGGGQPAGSITQFKIANATGSPGTGWDEIVMNALSITTNGDGSAVVDVQPISLGTTTNGSYTNGVNNFSSTGSYTWELAHWSSGTYATSNFVLDTNALSTFETDNGLNPATSIFSLSVVADSGSGQDLDLSYNSAPEPGTGMLVISGGISILSARRRRRPIRSLP